VQQNGYSMLRYRMCGGFCSSRTLPSDSASGPTVIYIQFAIKVWVISVHRTFRQVYFIFIIKPTRCTNFSNLFLESNYMFQTVALSTIRSLVLYTQQWYMSYRFADSLLVGVKPVPSWSHEQAVSKMCMIYTCCCVYSAKLLMVDRPTVRNV